MSSEQSWATLVEYFHQVNLVLLQQHELLIELLHILRRRRCLRAHWLLCSYLLLDTFAFFGIGLIGHLSTLLIISFGVIVFCLIFIGLTAGRGFLAWRFLLRFQLGIFLLLRLGDALAPFHGLLSGFLLRDTVWRGACARVFGRCLGKIIGICFGRVVSHFILNLYFKFKLGRLIAIFNQ